MKFSEIAGHNETIRALRSIVDAGKIPHAIMLSGISGIGKFRLARALAQYIHCQNHVNGDSCGVCPSCKQHQNLNNPDIHFIYPVIKRDGILVSKDLADCWKEMMTEWSYMPPEKWNEIIQQVIHARQST